ncbi:MAG TPA: AsnC family transcriptional regulator [Clostridiales bacterium]|nr:AsnC family transcriptional regulator [Clostridiales bacterium]
MTKLEKSILNLLKEDARYTASQLAVMLASDEETVAKTISSLEKKGIIVKYSAIVNTEKTGEDFVDALIEVKCTPQARSGFDAIASEIYNLPEVKSVYLMSGTYDLCIQLESKTVRDVSLFVSERLSTIDGVAGTTTHFIMKQYKEGGVIMTDDDNRRLVIHE